MLNLSACPVGLFVDLGDPRVPRAPASTGVRERGETDI